MGLIAFVAAPDASASTAAHAGGASASGAAVRAAALVHASAGDPAGWNTNIDASGNSFFNNSSTFNGISCPTTSTCFAGGYIFSNAGDTAQVFESTDGGSTWNNVPEASISSAYIDDISCVSTTVCVEVGGNRPPGPTGQAAQVDVGSGVVATRSVLPAGTGEIGWVKCVASGLCWADAANRVALKSTDSGLHWATMSVVPSVGGRLLLAEGMAFTSPTSGWLSATYDCTTPGFCRGFMEHTTDGGTTWHLAGTPASMPSMFDVHCPTASECLAVGGTNSPAAYMTYDGGARWVPMTLPHGMVFANGVSCGDANHCYIVGSNELYGHGVVIYATTNAGRSWTIQPVGSAYDLIDIACPSALHCVASGFWDGDAAVTTTTDGGVPSQGYNFGAADGGVFTFGPAAAFFGSAGNLQLPAPIVGIARSSYLGGYWLAGADGSIYNYGAPFEGSLRGKALNKPIVAIAGTRDGFGYDLVATDGGVFPFGDAHFFGSTGNVHLNKPIVDMAIDTETGGYWLVASDGGIFDFNAPYLGSTGSVHLNKPIVAMAEDTATGGYWLVASDGGIFDFHAPYYGSTGGVHLNQPIIGMQPTPDDHGYWLFARDGGVFQFGDAKYYGSTGSVHLNAPIVGVASAS